MHRPAAPCAAPVNDPALRLTAATPRTATTLPLDPVETVRSEELFHGAHELHIAHGDSLYRLRITSLGKLILTK